MINGLHMDRDVKCFISLSNHKRNGFGQNSSAGMNHWYDRGNKGITVFHIKLPIDKWAACMASKGVWLAVDHPVYGNIQSRCFDSWITDGGFLGLW